MLRRLQVAWWCRWCQKSFESDAKQIRPGVLDPIHNYFLLSSGDKPMCIGCYEDLSSTVEEDVAWCEANPHLMRHLRSELGRGQDAISR